MPQKWALLKNSLVASYAKNCLRHIGFERRGSVRNLSNGTLFVHSTKNKHVFYYSSKNSESRGNLSLTRLTQL